MKKYCTQNNGDCGSCSLSHYGRDCHNNPIDKVWARGGKWNRAMENYHGHHGSATIEHVERNIRQAYPTAYAELTGIQYGKLMDVANVSYHDGKAGAGAEMCDDKE